MEAGREKGRRRRSAAVVTTAESAVVEGREPLPRGSLPCLPPRQRLTGAEPTGGGLEVVGLAPGPTSKAAMRTGC